LTIIVSCGYFVNKKISIIQISLASENFILRCVYKQVEIARFLGISDSPVSKVDYE